MEEKSWKEMNGWEKTWEVTKVVAGFAIFVLPFVLPEGEVKPRPRQTVWKPKFYRPTGGPKGWKY